MKTLPMLICFALAVSGTAACAQTQERHPYFDRMDTDKSGYLTKEEVQKRFPGFSDAMFKQADTNNDGRLTLEEWQTFARAKMAERKGARM